MKWFLTAVLMVTAFARTGTAAVVLDFESFRQEDALIHYHPGIIELNGLRLTSVPPPGNAFLFSSAGVLNPLFAGSTGLWNGQSDAEIVLTRTDGGEFSLLSIDLAAIAPGAGDPTGLTNPGPFEMTFTGERATGELVTNTFLVNNHFLSFETFSFFGFDDVVSVSWFQGSGFNPPGPPLPGQASHQFDNIVLDVGTAAVPEPSSILIWLVCLAVVGAQGVDQRLR